MAAVADTSYVLALAIASQKGHDSCKAVHRNQTIIYLPQTTLAEVAYMLTREIGNKQTAQFLLDLPQTKYRIEPLTPADVHRSAEIISEYSDSRVDFVDASIIAVAERKQINTILTLD
jgi:predicted nucleic acid-binding protein